MLVCPQCGEAYAVGEGYCPMDGAPLTPEAGNADGLVGRVIDRRYRIDRRIGTGSMGDVYRATHTLIGKALAVKVLRDEHVGDPQIVPRFVQEARLASSIKHPNVVEISDFGALEEGNAFFVMELLEGRTVAARIDDEGPLPPKTALSVALQIVLGLEAAHAQGIVHRDLKAENVFLCAGGPDAEFLVKLLDFGIARAAGSRLTAAGAMLGTPEYMAPEQVRGLEVDARTDLYALGIIMFELLTGKVPFSSTSVPETLRGHLEGRPPRLVEARAELDRFTAIDALIADLLAKSPDARPGSAREVFTRLREAMEHDFGQETAERLHRSTLALGSASLPEGPPAGGPTRESPMGWGARTGGTLRPENPDSVPEPEPRDVVARPAAPSRPEPVLATTDAGAGPSSPPRFGVIMASAAVVAAATTFVLVWGLGGFATPATGEPRSLSPARAPEPMEPPVTPVRAADPQPKPSSLPLEDPPETDTQPSAVPSTTSTPDVGETITPIAKPSNPPRTAHSRRNTSPRPTKTRGPAGEDSASPSQPTQATGSGAQATGPAGQAPSQEPTSPAPEPPPKSASPPIDGDLKDPFSRN
jgi:serine/threonine protein kinase